MRRAFWVASQRATVVTRSARSAAIRAFCQPGQFTDEAPYDPLRFRDPVPRAPGAATWRIASSNARSVLPRDCWRTCHVGCRHVAVLANGLLAVHQALLWRQWCTQVTLLQHTGPEPSPDERAQLTARGVTSVTGLVVAVEMIDGTLSGVRLEDGQTVDCEAVVVGPRFDVRTELLDQLGIDDGGEMNGVVLGQHVRAKPDGATNVPGVWVAGNFTDPMAPVITAAARSPCRRRAQRRPGHRRRPAGHRNDPRPEHGR